MNATKRKIYLTNLIIILTGLVVGPLDLTATGCWIEAEFRFFPELNSVLFLIELIGSF